ncbi:hypothetical protein D1B31_16630 [Neobacillus notoginsengisoli]|uniref:FAD/FMN-containing dehydrogenase n=1 Tax=Neobacillus notoginsengisoli TaxID=1578198 RepID=A0A417YRA8_9BACI|nr:hypothetical protein [Neobacillus notoginsengisoli]RHW37385.1 hypothetical protein D1B31_16630 [Neobacillus notoginsengisoli]
MKRLAIVLMSTAFVLGMGSFALAQTNGSGKAILNFKEMLPFMQEMHPDSTEQELQEMYKACHGNGEESSPAGEKTQNTNSF